jgi:hypothetical protein
MNANIDHDEPHLLVDYEVGRILDAPPRSIKSCRWADSHPFVEIIGDTLVAGPDAARVAAGSGGHDFVEYSIDREVAGFLHLTRVA